MNKPALFRIRIAVVAAGRMEMLLEYAGRSHDRSSLCCENRPMAPAGLDAARTVEDPNVALEEPRAMGH